MSVEEFLDALKPGTRSVYEPGLKLFEEFYGKSAEYFLDVVEEDIQRPRREKTHVERGILRKWTSWMLERGLSPKSVRTYVSAVQSYGNYNEVKISTRFTNMPSSHAVSEKYSWTLEKFVKFADELSPGHRPVAVSIFQSGIGPEDLSLLTYGDIKIEYEAGVEPMCLDLARVKTDVPFMTFLESWGCELLRDSLKGRRPGLNDRLFIFDHRSLTREFEGIARKWLGEWRGQNPMRPYSLRAAFRTLMSDAECPFDTVEFFMGHEVEEQIRVYNSRSKDGWREMYKKYSHAVAPNSDPRQTKLS